MRNDLITSALSDAKRYGMDDEEDQDDEPAMRFTEPLQSSRKVHESTSREKYCRRTGGDSSTSPRPPPPPPVQTTTTTTTTPKSNST